MDGFCYALQDYLRADAYDVVLPTSDETTIALSLHRHEFRPFVGMAVPDSNAITTANDKFALLQMAQQLGIAVPKTFCPESVDEVKQIAGEIDYPCVFKLRRGAGAEGLHFPETPHELVQCYENLPGTQDLVSTPDPRIRTRRDS